jgi:hypothetical protein
MGRIPAEAVTADGRLDVNAVPDFVVVEDSAGREVGFISKMYLTSGWTPTGE